MRDDAALAAAIKAGLITFNEDTPCTTKRCDSPLLDPIAFNPQSRIDGGYVCESCNSWEHAHGTKQPL